jgi:nicotinamide-nucleotide amidase
MRAEIVSVGTELLLGQTVDTNATKLGEVFAEFGLIHTHRQTVGDNAVRLTEALRLALSRSDLVVTIGGLGPTEDDLTRDGIAEALAESLVIDEDVASHLKNLFKSRNIPWTESQLRQAQRPPCAAPIPNPNGSAPGLICRKDGKVVVALPGPPNEFNPMVDGPLRSLLQEMGDGMIISSRFLRVVGIGEAALEAKIFDLLSLPDVTVAPYAKVGEVHLRLTTRAESEAAAESPLRQVEDQIRERLGDAIYATGNLTLPGWIVQELSRHKATVSVAESCTGGLLGAQLSSIDGSSAAFSGGIIAYLPTVKEDKLGVSRHTIECPDHGSVSARCAEEMAGGVRHSFGTTIGVSITGVAGAQPIVENGVEKPSGLVFIGVAGPTGTGSHRHFFPGNRETIRKRSVQMALVSLRMKILEVLGS